MLGVKQDWAVLPLCMRAQSTTGGNFARAARIDVARGRVIYARGAAPYGEQKKVGGIRPLALSPYLAHVGVEIRLQVYACRWHNSAPAAVQRNASLMCDSGSDLAGEFGP